MVARFLFTLLSWLLTLLAFVFWFAGFAGIIAQFAAAGFRFELFSASMLSFVFSVWLMIFSYEAQMAAARRRYRRYSY